MVFFFSWEWFCVKCLYRDDGSALAVLSESCFLSSGRLCDMSNQAGVQQVDEGDALSDPLISFQVFDDCCFRCPLDVESGAQEFKHIA